MKQNKKVIPYIITIYGTLETETDNIEKMKEELNQTNIQFLISNSDSKFVEVNEDELNRMIENKQEDKVC